MGSPRRGVDSTTRFTPDVLSAAGRAERTRARGTPYLLLTRLALGAVAVGAGRPHPPLPARLALDVGGGGAGVWMLGVAAAVGGRLDQRHRSRDARQRRGNRRGAARDQGRAGNRPSPAALLRPGGRHSTEILNAELSPLRKGDAAARSV